MAAVLFIFLSGSGADGVSNPSLAPNQARELDGSPRAAPDKCPSARKAVRYYERRLYEWRAKMGQEPRRERWETSTSATASPKTASATASCPRFLAHALQRKARAARHAYERWSREWEWQRWLPAKWYRIARCETGVRWDWNSGTYQGAFGFYWGTWDAYKPRGAPSEAYLATPRQQYETALNVYADHGYGAWGCGGA